jgi:integrase
MEEPDPNGLAHPRATGDGHRLGQVSWLLYGENAARWKGHLALHLQRPEKVRSVRRYPAFPYRDIPEFLRKRRGIVAVALEFALLTAERHSEARDARWHESDLDSELWTIPASRMKMRREHRVVLNEPALAMYARWRGSKTAKTTSFSPAANLVGRSVSTS